jgi:hypothetical protein
MPTNPIPAPTILIDEIVEITASKGRGIVVLSSCGTPVRLALGRHELFKLGRMAVKVGSELFLDDGAEVLEFPPPKAKARRARK